MFTKLRTLSSRKLQSVFKLLKFTERINKHACIHWKTFVDDCENNIKFSLGNFALYGISTTICRLL